MSSDCIFCDIITGKTKAYKIYDDEDFIIILDAYPQSIGHCLIITKDHIPNTFEMPEHIAKRLMPLANKLALILKLAFNMEGLNIIQNNGAIAKQVIMHYHMHLIPRYIKSTGMAKDKIEDTANKLLHPEFLIK